MHKPGFVEGIERRADLAGEPGRLLQRERSVRVQPASQGASRDVLDSQVVTPVRLARLEDPDEIRVLDLGGDPGLPEEAPDERLVLGELLLQELDGDGVAAARRLGAEHDAHGAAAKLFLESVGADLRIRASHSSRSTK